MLYQNPIEIAGRQQRAGEALNFATYAGMLALTKGEKAETAALFAHLYPDSRAIDAIRKSAIPAATTTDTAWGGALSPLSRLVTPSSNTFAPGRSSAG